MNLVSVYVVSFASHSSQALPPSPASPPSCNKGYIDHVSKKGLCVSTRALPLICFSWRAGTPSLLSFASAYFNKLETLESRGSLQCFGLVSKLLQSPQLYFKTRLNCLTARRNKNP